MNLLLPDTNRRSFFKWWLVLGATLAGGLTLTGLLHAPADVSADTLTDRLIDAGLQPATGTLPPADFSLPDLQGNRLRLSDFRGKVVFLTFWTTWCPNCRTEMPALENLGRRFQKRDFVLLTVDIQESVEQAKRFLETNRLSLTTLLDSDGQVARSFGIHSIPTTFIIAKDGGMLGRAIGPRSWDRPGTLALLEYLVAAPYPPEPIPSSDQAPSMKKNPIQ